MEVTTTRMGSLAVWHARVCPSVAGIGGEKANGAGEDQKGGNDQADGGKALAAIRRAGGPDYC
jgi:hypothetical protein